ncbi:MAG: DUF1009 domain-containing protein [Rhodobacteraceae bacterium]|nr:DUF1009 domain-containing protein [Paracoccaceae bacterium]
MLALIAGTGALPREIVSCVSDEPLVCAMAGSEPDQVSPHLTFRIEELGTFILYLKEKGVTELCMAGSVKRPPVDPTAIDAATMPLVPIIQAAIGSGDDGALRAMIGIFEKAGLSVRAAQDIAPGLLMEPGVPTDVQPGELDKADAARGAEIVAAMAVADTGQACAVRGRQALALEGIFGTDWMLKSLEERPDGQGGILYKAPKPGQELRADLPTIGPDTVERAGKAGLGGIVLQAGGVIVLEQEAVIAACNRLNMFLWLREG